MCKPGDESEPVRIGNVSPETFKHLYYCTTEGRNPTMTRKRAREGSSTPQTVRRGQPEARGRGVPGSEGNVDCGEHPRQSTVRRLEKLRAFAGEGDGSRPITTTTPRPTSCLASTAHPRSYSVRRSSSPSSPSLARYYSPASRKVCFAEECSLLV